jgi:gas vesicle protein
MDMGFLGSAASFVAGAAAGVAGGILGARAFAPKSGDATRKSLEQWKSEVEAAGVEARRRTEEQLHRDYQATVRKHQDRLD